MNLLRAITQGRPTSGGLYGWGDVLLFRDWRIQQRVGQERYRLLNGWNQCLITGSEEDCRRKLEAIKQERQLTPWQGESVLLLHALAHVRYSMNPLARHLRKLGFHTYQFSYPSTREPIEQHAQRLRKVIAELPAEAAPLHLVGHSLGGIVIRAALDGWHDERLGRCVFLGVPHQGAEKADQFAHWKLFQWFFGPSGDQLRLPPHGIVNRLPPTLDLEFASIAGGTGKPGGFSMVTKLSGDNDFTVTVQSTKLPGAADWARTRCLHFFMPCQRTVQTWTGNFLRFGYLQSAEQRSRLAPPAEMIESR